MNGWVKTYLDNIERHARLGRESILVTPLAREARLEESRLLFSIAHVEEKSNVVLLEGSESRAEHGSDTDTAIQLCVQRQRVITPMNAPRKETDEITRSLEDGTTLRDRNMVSESPGQLLESADKALVRTLWTVLRERRLYNN